MKKKIKVIFLFLSLFIFVLVSGFVIVLHSKYSDELFKKIGLLNENIIAVLPTPEPQKEASFTFAIGGDAMLGRAVAWHFENDVVKAFTNLPQNFFGSNDLGIINLEGPISSENIKPDPTADNFVFNFPFNSIDALKYLGLNAVSLANNHSENQRNIGFETTKELLDQASILPIGSQTTFDGSSIVKFEGGGINLSVITINILANKDDLTTSIKQEKDKGNLVLIFPHWGNEYQSTHSGNQQELAHAWIDAGADVVIGSHPHVLQDAEIYQNKFIFYSLGNFIFDQNFSEETQHGMILSGRFTNNNLEITFLPTVIKKYQTTLLDGQEKDAALEPYRNSLGVNNFIDDTLTIAAFD